MTRVTATYTAEDFSFAFIIEAFSCAYWRENDVCGGGHRCGLRLVWGVDRSCVAACKAGAHVILAWCTPSFTCTNATLTGRCWPANSSRCTANYWRSKTPDLRGSGRGWHRFQAIQRQLLSPEVTPRAMDMHSSLGGRNIVATDAAPPPTFHAAPASLYNARPTPHVHMSFEGSHSLPGATTTALEAFCNHTTTTALEALKFMSALGDVASAR